ncbi:MAG: cation transporter [Leptolyngbyaceae cyanobacterium SM1_3_5]|nr:cation transporter [Leptolyngbyaceae cyanobacterium SM1_3_5]
MLDHANCVCHRSDPVATRRLWVAIVLIASFAFTEAAIGLWSHSLALVAEAGHMVSDAFSLGLVLFASWLARRPASSQASFGYRRIEILAALGNGLVLVGIALSIATEAIERLQTSPNDILSLPMLITAAIGLGINSLIVFLLHNHTHNDLNLRGAVLHLVADAVSSIGVILAAIAVSLWHWNWADGAISLLVALLMIVAALPLIRQSLHILLEKPPLHLNVSAIEARLQQFDGVVRVEQLRVWSIAFGARRDRGSSDRKSAGWGRARSTAAANSSGDR